MGKQNTGNNSRQAIQRQERQHSSNNSSRPQKFELWDQKYKPDTSYLLIHCKIWWNNLFLDGNKSTIIRNHQNPYSIRNPSYEMSQITSFPATEINGLNEKNCQPTESWKLAKVMNNTTFGSWKNSAEILQFTICCCYWFFFCLT